MLILMAAIALPDLRNLLLRQRAVTTQNMLAAHLQLARSAAIWKRRRIQVCPSNDGSTCAQGTDWSRRWLVFVDGDGDGQPNRQADIIRQTAAPSPDAVVIRSNPGRTHVRYLPDGRSAGSNQTISICDHQANLLAAVIVNNSGRVRSATPSSQNRRCPK
ncbi:GspH/FimT family pseudopilin [Stenotrophomonas sp.]|uniref:GspH/FimT family protein n=1 Tax=Stenotrophomonas sp. TaxID=69392 RepID=UPI0028B2046B|nr:GspH/FimT family pseudopilin [Stenotrophomonas sp.]